MRAGGGGGHDGLEHVLWLAGGPAQAQAAVRVAGGGGVGGARPVERPAAPHYLHRHTSAPLLRIRRKIVKLCAGGGGGNARPVVLVHTRLLRKLQH